jgi:hypothetical protein
VTRQRPCPRRATRASLHPARNTNREVDGAQEISGIMARLREAASLSDTLAAGLDAFEAIRLAARDCEDKVPALFAAFMTTADTAVEAREAITIAPALPPDGRGGAGVRVPGASAPVEEVAGALAALGALLWDRLSHAATIAATAGDRTACTEAALAAGRICQLMTTGHDDSRPG